MKIKITSLQDKTRDYQENYNEKAFGARHVIIAYK